MLKALRACWRSISAGMFLLGLFWLPADVEQYGQALSPWQRLWAMVDRETLLWAFALGLFAWLVWTDVRPFVRGRLRARFPARHAEILRAISDQLAKADQIATHRINAMLPISESGKMGHLTQFHTESLRTEGLLYQIAYDGQTVGTVRDYLHLCGMILHDELDRSDTRESRSVLEQLRGPIYQALHSGKSINRSALPLPQWMLNTEERKPQ
jgi:hypothetical protein